MPEPLWQAAVALAETEGVYRTARALSINYQSLKVRETEATGATRRTPAPPPGFVELRAPLSLAPSLPAGPVLELVDGTGRKLTIRLPAEPVLDVERLAARLFERGQ